MGSLEDPQIVMVCDVELDRFHDILASRVGSPFVETVHIRPNSPHAIDQFGYQGKD